MGLGQRAEEGGEQGGQCGVGGLLGLEQGEAVLRGEGVVLAQVVVDGLAGGEEVAQVEVEVV